MESPLYIASCSFGKDSLATILLALEHNEPLDRAVFAEVMFDLERGISGEIPEHIEWIYGEAIPKLQSMGVRIDVVRSDIDYITSFRHIITKSQKYEGMTRGFPIGGRCVINRDCKMKPIYKYYKQFADREIIQYVGIASDEPKRLARLKPGMVSLMDKYGVTEKMAMEMCIKEGLLSPIYETGTRGGVGFALIVE